MTAALPAIGALARVEEIRTRFEAPATTPAGSPSPSGPTALATLDPRSAEFASMLMAATGRTALAPALRPGRLGAGALATVAPAPASSDQGAAIIRQGMTYLGVPYLWGGTDPEVGLDCSGFVQRAHRDLGIELPRVSQDQARGGVAVASLAEARPGDVLAFGEPVNHVALYLGDGQMVHAPRRGDVVIAEAIDRPITAIRRYTATGPAAAPAAATPTVPAAGSGALPGGTPFADLFAAAGARHGIDPRILSAVARVESGYNPQAVSRAGARGLMQFMPATAAGMGIDPMDPAQAVDGAARYLTTQLRAFGTLELALAAYNAGPGAVRRHGGIPPYPETQAYVRKVTDILNGGS